MPALRRAPAGLVRWPREARGRRAVPRERHPRPRHPPRAARGGREHYLLFGGRPDQRPEPRPARRDPRGLRGAGLELPVYWGNRNWDPYLPNARADGRRRGHPGGLLPHLGLLVVLLVPAVPREPRRRGRRGRRARHGWTGCGTTSTTRASSSRWSTRPSPRWPSCPRRRAGARLVFVTHSIPEAMNDGSGPRAAPTSPSTAASRRGRRPGRRGDRPRGPSSTWSSARAPGRRRCRGSSPTSTTTSRSSPARRRGAVVLVPIGFVSDHMEVVYDLDTEALATAERLGLPCVRAADRGHRPAVRGDGARPAARARRGRARRAGRPRPSAASRPARPLPGRLLPQPARPRAALGGWLTAGPRTRPTRRRCSTRPGAAREAAELIVRSGAPGSRSPTPSRAPPTSSPGRPGQRGADPRAPARRRGPATASSARRATTARHQRRPLGRRPHRRHRQLPLRPAPLRRLHRRRGGRRGGGRRGAGVGPAWTTPRRWAAAPPATAQPVRGPARTDRAAAGLTGFGYEPEARRRQAPRGPAAAAGARHPPPRLVRARPVHVAEGAADAYVEEGLHAWDYAAGGSSHERPGRVLC